MKVTVGGNLLGKVWLDRNATTPQSTAIAVSGASRRVRVLESRGDGAELPKIEDLGKNPAALSLTTEQCFRSTDAAALWLLDLAITSGFSGKGIFETNGGSSRDIEFVIANASNGRHIGATVFVDWELILGRELT